MAIATFNAAGLEILEALLNEIRAVLGEPGLSTFSDVSSPSATALSDGAWVTIYSDSNISDIIKMIAVTIDITVAVPVSPLWRIRAIATGGSLAKVFPFGASIAVDDNVEQLLSNPVQIPAAYDFDIQVYCTTANGASAEVTSLKKITYGD